MRFYKLFMAPGEGNDIILRCKNCKEFDWSTFQTGKYYSEISNFTFYYDEEEGYVWTDYLANENGWFIVSERFKFLLKKMNSDIQFIDVGIYDIKGINTEKKYYIANIIKVVDALCLDKSDYSETYIEGIGMICNIRKYGIYENKTEGADVFKLDRHHIPIFVSEKFKNIFESEHITGLSFLEIAVE